jgi:hypothetical protein
MEFLEKLKSPNYELTQPNNKNINSDNVNEQIRSESPCNKDIRYTSPNENYKKTNIEINEIKFDAVQKEGSKLYIIHAKNLSTGKNEYYEYDKELNSIITYSDNEVNPLEKEIQKYKTLIVILGAETIFVTLILIIILIVTIVKRSKRRKLAKEQLRIKQELEEKKKQKNKKLKEDIE